MFRKIVIVVVVAIAGVLAYAATRPDTFEVRRSASIDAPAAAVFALINDFQQWGLWSPYEKMDPAMRRTFSGPPSGPGATYDWDSERDVGAGRMRITDAVHPDAAGAGRVALDLDFVRPLETRNKVEFTLQPSGAATRVTWTMRGEQPYVAKVMHLFFDMDAMLGANFEAGLADLKAVAER